MRKIFLSLFLHIMPVPALGQSSRMAVSPIYGNPAPAAVSQRYAPQLHLSCRITLKDAIDVVRDRLYLEDIASCEGPANLCRDAMAVEIAPSPKPGMQSKLRRPAIGKSLEMEFPQHSFIVEGPDLVSVSARGIAANMETLRQSLEDLMAQQDGPLRFKLQNLRSAALVRLRHENYSFSFPGWKEELKRLQDVPRRTLVTLKVRASDFGGTSSEVFEWPLQLTLQAQLLTLVATRSLPRGSPLGDADVAMRWLPFQENVLRNANELVGKTLRMAVREGQALRPYELIQEPDVKRGEKIEAAILSGGIRMNGTGQAMETGVVGQKIRVQLDSTKRQMMGVIIAKSLVEVQMP